MVLPSYSAEELSPHVQKTGWWCCILYFARVFSHAFWQQFEF